MKKTELNKIGDKDIHGGILLNKDDLAILFNCHPRTIDRLVKTKRIPKPIKISKRMLRWKKETINNFLERKER